MVRRTQEALLRDIDDRIGEVRTDAVDLSFGEIINLQGEDEIVINPEYQRLFRWSDEQKSRLVESILLRLPIPPVFFIENPDGKLELIDGLQRISSMIQFIDPDQLDLAPLKLVGCDIIEALNEYTFADLPLALKLQLKRASVRAIVIKRQSQSFLRYEMFKRLNTGGSLLSPQEIRNCSARIFGDRGIEFYDDLMELAQHESFSSTTETLADVDIEKRGKEELVLRFFAAKHGQDFYAGHVADWLDTFMERTLLEDIDFSISSQKRHFKRVFNAIERSLGEGAFCKYRNGEATGGLAPAHYEAISIAFSNQLRKCESADERELYNAVVAAKQSPAFRENVGPGANNRTKLRGRIGAIERAIELL